MTNSIVKKIEISFWRKRKNILQRKSSNFCWPLKQQKKKFLKEIFNRCYCVNKNKEASWLHAELFFVLVSMWLPQQHMVSIWTPHGIHVETMWCPVETTSYPLLKPCVVHLETTLCPPGNQMVSTWKPHGVHMETT